MMGTPGHIPVYNQMFKEQSKIIRKLAGYGSGVFLGRCADYVLKDMENVYTIYLYADDEFRLNHLSEAEGREVTKSELRRKIRQENLIMTIIRDKSGAMFRIMIWLST